MKHKILFILLCIMLVGCQKETTITTQEKLEQPIVQEEIMQTISIQINDQVFHMKLYNNDASKTLIENLPMQIQMDDLNGNEKYNYTDIAFPTKTESVDFIKTGDLMLYGNNCLVLFYQDFPTSFSYTRLGYLEDTTGFNEALSEGSVEVTIRQP